MNHQGPDSSTGYRSSTVETRPDITFISIRLGGIFGKRLMSLAPDEYFMVISSVITSLNKVIGEAEVGVVQNFCYVCYTLPLKNIIGTFECLFSLHTHFPRPLLFNRAICPLRT